MRKKSLKEITDPDIYVSSAKLDGTLDGGLRKWLAGAIDGQGQLQGTAGRGQQLFDDGLPALRGQAGLFEFGQQPVMTFAESGRRFVAGAGGCELGVERGDPVVDQLQALSVDNLRAEVWHAASAELGHAIEQDRTIGRRRCHHPGGEHAESALGGAGTEEVGLFERELVPDVHGRSAAAAATVTRCTVGVQVRAGTGFQRKDRVSRIGHRRRSLGRRIGEEADMSHRPELVVDDRPVGVVAVELSGGEAVDRTATGRVTENALGATGVVPGLDPFSAGRRGVSDDELVVGGLVVGQDRVGSGVVPDVVVGLPRLSGEMQQLGFDAAS